MARTYIRVLIHGVFSTKQQEPYLTDEIKAELFAFLVGPISPDRSSA